MAPMSRTSAPPPALAVDDLTKDFPAVRALHRVGLAFAPGEVHGIVGENGAGKSTLVRIVAGLHQPTAGRISVAGRPVVVRNPARAGRLGIAMVHQELTLVGELSVADNIFLGRERTRAGLIRRSATHAAARALLDRVGCPVDPSAKLRTLSIAQQQLVEIAKALSCEASVLILDEPTAVLTRRETATLFELIGRLKAQGVTIVYISHILPEVLAICDRITVMRDGRVVRTLDRPEAGDGAAAEAMLGSLMVGRPMADHFPPRSEVAGAAVLSVRGLDAAPHVRDVSFEVRAGEILGLAGLIGAGRTEMAEAIAGLRRRLGGQVALEGRPVPAEPRAAVDAGVAYLSEDRRGRGLLVARPVVENVTLVSLRRYSRGLIDRAAERRAAGTHVERLGIRLGRLDDPVATLSGGNQQKVALAKWLETRPKVLILDEPTRGVDIGAKEEIYRLVQQLTAEGLACLFISSELNELLGLCHRIGVMRAGRIVAMLDVDECSEETIMFHAAGVTPDRGVQRGTQGPGMAG